MIWKTVLSSFNIVIVRDNKVKSGILRSLCTHFEVTASSLLKCSSLIDRYHSWENCAITFSIVCPRLETSSSFSFWLVASKIYRSIPQHTYMYTHRNTKRRNSNDTFSARRTTISSTVPSPRASAGYEYTLAGLLRERESSIFYKV